MNSAEPDLLREALCWAIEELMEPDLSAARGGTPRTDAQADRAPDRPFDSGMGALEIAIPETRTGSSLPDWLIEPRRGAERALVAVIEEGDAKGGSARTVDDLVRAIGASGVSRREVSRLVAELDSDLAAFWERRLNGVRYPDLWVDAQDGRVREDGRVRSTAFLVSVALNKHGEREGICCAVAGAESEASRTRSLRSLAARGPSGVRLAISDAHLGVRAAIGHA